MGAYLGVDPKIDKNRGLLPPKWMVKISWKTPIKMDDLVVPLFLETSI